MTCEHKEWKIKGGEGTTYGYNAKQELLCALEGEYVVFCKERGRNRLIVEGDNRIKNLKEERVSLPTPEESRREIAENKGRRLKKRDPFYPPDLERQDREDASRCDYCDELPDDCQCH